MLGFTGGLSFGHAAYFGLGAYGAGMTLKYLVPSTPLAIVVGTLAGGIAATLLGPLVMRRRGIYFAMITIAIGQLFYFVAVRWNNVTGGEDGLAGFRRQPLHFGSFVYDVQVDTKFYYLVLFCFVVAVVIMRVLLASPLGHTWVAIRENRRRAQFLGLRTDLYVWAAFAISGTLTALAGTLNAMLFNFTSPQDLHWILSGNFVIMMRAGRHAEILGADGRRRDLRRRAGLPVEPDRQLDDGDRDAVRADRAALPERHSRTRCAAPRARGSAPAPEPAAAPADPSRGVAS